MNSKDKTIEYFDKYNVLSLIEFLGTKLTSEKPNNPNEYLILELSKLIASRSRQTIVSLFNEKDIRTLFSTFDLTNRGYLNKIQFLNGKKLSITIIIIIIIIILIIIFL